MPIYEYVCERCGRLSEVMQKLSDPPPAACPDCGGGPLAKLVSRTSFQLKGGGWYADLYSSSKRNTEGGPEPGAAKPGGAPAPAQAAPAAAPAPAPAGGSPSPGGSSPGAGSGGGAGG